MPASIYLETTIPSYYVARASPSILLRSRQELTREWWDIQRWHYRLYTSQTVPDEAAVGDTEMVAARLRLLTGIPLLPSYEKVQTLANELLGKGIVPTVAATDAVHLATAGVHFMNVLLTWNCTHLANPFLTRRLASCFSKHGVHLPIICTPDQLATEDHEDTQESLSEEP